MIVGYKELNTNILKTTEIITDIASTSKEQQFGIEQINDAITILDQGTQRNAAVASETAQIANSTSEMAKAIVNEVNEANFIGKGTIKKIGTKAIYERNTTQLSSSNTPKYKKDFGLKSNKKEKSPTLIENKEVTQKGRKYDEGWESF